MKSSTSNNAPSANFISAKNLLHPCPPSLLKALHPSNPDRQAWLDSYNEEKGGLERLDVFERINKKTYLALRRKGIIPKALPSMCVLLVKPDKDGNPHRVKSRIVVLGNFEDRIYDKSQRYAPVLKYSSLRLLTSKCVGDRRVLKQADCKNAFCNATLPDDERMAVLPPVGDPAHANDEVWLLNKTLYGLRRSPHHWYNMFTAILKKIGLTASRPDPCLYTGVVNDSSAAESPPATSDNDDEPLVTFHTRDPKSRAPKSSTTRKELSIGIYVDDFVYYSNDPAEEKIFEQELAKHLKVDFMGVVDYFLGTAFTWKEFEDGNVSVHMTQSAFTEYTAHRFGVDRMNRVPNMTPYRSGLPIDSIAPPDPSDPDLNRRTKMYQSLVGCMNWLATCTRPDISPALTFLASYSNNPSAQHYKSAVHALKYLFSTSDYGISFHSNSCNTFQAFNHFPHHHDKEAYNDATPPSPSECNQLTAYSDANWGGHFGSAVPDGTPLELFKYRSLSGYLICRTGGPIAWKSIRQEQTAQSSCEAEIIATNECVKELLHIKHCTEDLNIPDATDNTVVYNDNQACVNWSKSCTTKGVKHLNLKENKIRETHAAHTATIAHIPGIINSSDIFTKEIKDASHYRCLRDSFMVSKANFDRYGHNVPSHMAGKTLPYYSIRSEHPASSAESSTDTSALSLPALTKTSKNTNASDPVTAQRSTSSRDHGKQISRSTCHLFPRQGGVVPSRVNKFGSLDLLLSH